MRCAKRQASVSEKMSKYQTVELSVEQTSNCQIWLMSLIDEVVLVLPLNLQEPQLRVWQRKQRNSQSAADRATNFTERRVTRHFCKIRVIRPTFCNGRLHCFACNQRQSVSQLFNGRLHCLACNKRRYDQHSAQQHALLRDVSLGAEPCPVQHRRA